MNTRKEANPKEAVPSKLARFRREFQDDMEERGGKILIELANLRDDNDACMRFRRLFRFDRSIEKYDSTILHFRDQLRMLWRKEKEEDRIGVLHDWLNHACVDGQQTWSVGSYADGTYAVEPRYTNFPLALALAASAWQPKMAVCENPDCPQRYFFKGRRTQRFCDRPMCAEYGQRQHKINWWRKNREDWKRKRLKTRRSKNL
jgi:hypothetical protein